MAAEEQERARRLALEEQRFRVEEAELNKLAKFRDQQYRRFSQPAAEIAQHVAQFLKEDPHWAQLAIEGAKLLPYTGTIFGERSQHFPAEKQELASRFAPYLLKRCEVLAMDGKHVFLMIDAGSTLYPFFDIIGKETVRLYQRGEKWLSRLHLATNSLPGIEQLIKIGRCAPGERYSKLAIEDCHLLPGIPLPIFAAVAGIQTRKAIRLFRRWYNAHFPKASVTFVALVVGNWVRVRNSDPRPPIPMARGIEHLDVKQAFVDNADEVFVVSPLGKIFVGQSNDKINDVLGFSASSSDPDKEKYGEVNISDAQARRVKLVTTTRADNRLLHSHGETVRGAVTGLSKQPLLAEIDFARATIENVPHMFFPFGSLPAAKIEEFHVEVPHEHTRRDPRFLEMFGIDLAQFL